ALSEITARTLSGPDGHEHAGQEVVTALMDRTLRAMTRQRQTQRIAQLHEMIRRTANRPDVEDLIAQHDALATEGTPRHVTLLEAAFAGTASACSPSC